MSHSLRRFFHQRGNPTSVVETTAADGRKAGGLIDGDKVGASS
ncbi:hypothetical protein I549_4863 [Mycobacterium avium subsp. avium 2285 (R)]|nr:hypothetical protein I549_4863 [Mycobacterium avium subsp. avium 2285 (R)]